MISHILSWALICTVLFSVFLFGFWAGARAENRRLKTHVYVFMNDTIVILNSVRSAMHRNALSERPDRTDRDIDKAVGKSVH